MKRFVIFSLLLWSILTFWSSTASAAFSFQTESEAWSACLYKAENSSHNYEDYDGCYDPNTSDNSIKYYIQSWNKDGAGDTYTWTDDCPVDEPINTSTGNCSSPPESPATCNEGGEFWQSSTSSCVSSCPNGSISYYCLEQAPVGVADTDDDGNECAPVSGGYQGILQGKHFCDSNLPEPAYCPNDQMAILTVGDNGVATFGCGQAISSPNDTPQSEQTTTTTETVGDITTITITNNQTGDTNTTTTNSSTGGSTSTTTYAGTDSETGFPCSGSSIACRPTSDEQKGFCADGGSLCDDVADIKDSFDQESDRPTLDGKFNTESANAGVVSAELALTTGLNQIKSEIGGYFDLSLSAGEIVCGGGVQVLGITLQICPSTMKNELQVIAQIVMLISGLLSLMIIFR